MKMKYRLTSILAFGFAIAALGQQSTPPPAAPTESGPTLAATMQFIQEKLSEQGQVGWAETMSNQPGWTHAQNLFNVSDVMADPAACALYTTETVESTIDLPKGKVLKPGGQLPLTTCTPTWWKRTQLLSNKSRRSPLRSTQDIVNQAYVEAAHPEITVTVTPPVFYVKLWASNAVFSVHTSTTKGSRAPVEKDVTSKTNGLPSAMRTRPIAWPKP